MEDREINEMLARVTGYERSPEEPDCELMYGNSVIVTDPSVYEFNYKDPAIFAENVKWLLDNGYWPEKIDPDGIVHKEYAIYNFGDFKVCDKDIFKCIALARIAASENEVEICK